MTMRTTCLLFFIFIAGAAHAGPQIQHWTLKNGVRVYFVASHELPMVDAHILFDAGAARDPAQRRGLAHLTVEILSEGVPGYDAHAIAEAFESRGVSTGDYVDQDLARLSLRSLSKADTLQTSARLFAQIL